MTKEPVLMDDTRLAQAVVDQLAPFLEDLIFKQPLSPSAGPGERKAYTLWEVIYPKVALRSGVMQAARKIAEDDTPENREALAMHLALVFRINTFLAVSIKQQIPDVSEDSQLDMAIPQPRLPSIASQSGSVEQEYGAEQISCQVCGNQDPSLRLISYPFVFSLLVITFRRMFQGVYCSRHANRYFVLAAIITLSVGWLGIPFGMIFTPVTLFNLFISDKRLRPANAKLLMEIAKAKQEKGSSKEAALFYSESLWLENKGLNGNSSLKMADALSVVGHIPLFFQIFSLLSGFAAAWLMGFLIGLVDGLISSPFNELDGPVSIMVIIFSYLPLVLALYLGGFLQAQFIRKMLERTLISNALIGRLIAAFTSFMAFYAILTGHLFFFVQINSDQVSYSLVNLIRVNGLMLVHGGWLSVIGVLQEGSMADLLFLVLVTLGFMAFMWLGQDWAKQTIGWRTTVSKVHGTDTIHSGAVSAASALLIVGILFVLLGLAFLPTQIITR